MAPNTSGPPPHRSRSDPPERITVAPGVTLAVRRYGDQQRPGTPTLVLLHPWGESSGCFDRLRSFLPAGLALVSIDQRGHGDSDAAPDGYDLATSATDVAKVMDAVGLASDVVLLGSSSGGYIAQEVAIAQPDRIRGLVLVGAPRTLRGRPPFADEVRALTDPVRDDWVRESLTWFPTFHDIPPWFIEDRVADGARISAGVWWKALQGLLDAIPPTEGGSITCPTLIIWGQRDELLPREQQLQLLDAIRGARLVEYPATGHLVLWEAPERVATDVTAFVGSLDERDT